MNNIDSTPTSDILIDPSTGRNLIVDSPYVTPPYPICVNGLVQLGFARGSKQLGIPTANLPTSCAEHICACAGERSGIYYGWASVSALVHDDRLVYPMVMSVGWNPFYKNEKRTAEVHVLHTFADDFYDLELRVLIAGYIRDEKDYESVDALITDIHVDMQVARHSLQRPDYAQLAHHPSLNHTPAV